MVFPQTSPASISAYFQVSPLAADNPVPETNAVQLLRAFHDSDIKFNLDEMTSMLRDHRHEGWVLAAYPDPNTHRPLIGAGFSLDLPERAHLQADALNAHPFMEPSTAQLWQAAGLPQERLQAILDEFARNMGDWTDKTYRHRVARQMLPPQLNEDEGEQLLRISAIQAVYNAKAYCRNFDQLNAAQQMALSQLVFQMGVNLQQFSSFLEVLNDPKGMRGLPQLNGYLENGSQHWRSVQTSLMESQWARRYSVRAASVIAMFDPAYRQDPTAAEQRILGVLHPAVYRRHGNRHTATLRLASYSKHRAHNKKSSHALSHSRFKRKLT